MAKKTRKWRIDRKVTPSVALVLTVNILGLIWWGATIEMRLVTLELWVNKNQETIERFKALEVKTEYLIQQTDRIEKKLDNVMMEQ